ncbi:MAG TPA: 6-phosphofructokinase [Planctomycetaceae bacterium]|nr:6-phosphofructokinase [Planctomycetaceae bacterium]
MSAETPSHGLRRIAILFAGGPAPAANAVISTCAASFLNHDVEVLGIKHGYSSLIDYTPDNPLESGKDYIIVDDQVLKRTRNQRGIIIGTARANPGKFVSHPDHMEDPEKVAPLKRVYEGLCSLGVDALVSIGGDDTLKTANKFKLYQDQLPDDAHRIPVVHLPKTIDNDYFGIDFTFGFFTAVEFLAEEIRNLIHDAEAGRAYFLAEAMGRSAGWLAYSAAIAGEASLVMSVEDIVDNFAAEEEYTNSKTGETTLRKIMNIDAVVDKVVRLMVKREEKGKEFGVIVFAEGLAEFLPMKYLEGIARDDHGHISISDVNLCSMMSGLIAEAYEQATGKKRKVNGVQLGYESRCAAPTAFDVMLGSQLGVGAYVALAEKGLNGVMVSVAGQLELHFAKFEDLVDRETLVTKVRYIERESDFYRLARFLETDVNE